MGDRMGGAKGSEVLSRFSVLWTCAVLVSAGCGGGSPGNDGSAVNDGSPAVDGAADAGTRETNDGVTTEADTATAIDAGEDLLADAAATAIDAGADSEADAVATAVDTSSDSRADSGTMAVDTGSDLAADAAAATDGGSADADGDAAASSIRLLGTWGFTSGTLMVACSDGSSQSKPLNGPADHIDVSAGTGSTVVADEYCPWVLDVSAVGNATIGTLEPGQNCTSSSGCTDFTWIGQSFTFSTSDGVTSQLNGTINATYKDYNNPAVPPNIAECLPRTATPATGTCTLTITGSLVR